MTHDSPTGPSIHAEIAPKLNFACHQSAFPFLRRLQVENGAEETFLENVQVHLLADPGFLKPKTWHLDRIPPQGSVTVADRDVQLDGGFLLGLSEAMRGTVTLRAEAGGEVLAESTHDVELLAHNEWGGAGFMPELLAAFSMPNDRAVDRILRDASGVLRRAGKPDAIDGYQAGSRARVWEIASAIYAAIANLGLAYALPPTSFERDGQKIRLPGQILDGGVGTCLDTTLLFAAALEQAGLNPVIALPEGHAVVGVWLQPEDLTAIVIDEAETLRKREQLQELIFIETTAVTHHPAVSFTQATQAASRTLAPENDASFCAAVDIRRARAHRISPLAFTGPEASVAADAAPAAVAEMGLEAAPDLPAFDDEAEEAEVKTANDRLERWHRKLLDLSARNPLLNHKATKLSLSVQCPDPGALEDKLADGSRIAIQSLRGSAQTGQDEQLHQQRTGEVISEAYARDALKKNQVLVDLPETELNKRAVEIYRRAQTSLQEGGANTLYLALGFLLWKREEGDERRYRAPLILLPVSLERKSVRSGVKIVKHDDEPRFNTTLLQMLRQDFRIEISGLDGVLPEDESGVDVDGIWNRVRKAVKDVPGFEVVEDVVLGHFSFAKYLMWKDLVDRTDALRENSVVSHLLDSPREPYGSGIEAVDGKQVDRAYTPADLLAPLPADAEQMAAVATADRGKDFIVVGPPGTGKSQTIANLIAHKLGKGETVLFVSEKTAALEVVYRRLNEINLSPFCLQLHSNKANKADVLKQLRQSWEVAEDRTADTWKAEADRLQRLRDQLNRVVDHLHHRYPNGLTPHEAMGVTVRDAAKAERVSLSWPHAAYHSGDDMAAMRELVANLQVQAREVAGIADSPFHVIARGDWSPNWESQTADAARQLARAATELDEAVTKLCEALGVALPDRSLDRLDALLELADVLMAAHRREIAWALAGDGPDRLEAMDAAIERLRGYVQARAGLSCAYAAAAWRHLDGDTIARQWSQAQARWWPKRIFARRAVIKAMRAGGAHGKPDPARDAEALAAWRREGEAIDRLDPQLRDLRAWAGHDTDPAALEELRDLGRRARAVAGRLVDNPDAYLETRATLRQVLGEGNDLLAPEASVGRLIETVRRAKARFDEQREAFETLADQAVRDHVGAADQALTAIRDTASAIADRHEELRTWCGWRKRRDEALNYGLRPLVEAIERGDVPAEDIPETFEAAYCAWWSRQVLEEDAVLRTFSSPEHSATIERFQEAVDRYQSVTARYIAAKLSDGRPTGEGFKRGSEWGTLRHEIQKKQRHKPVRQLVQDIPDVLTTLAPCLMMSPLSVAQYLPPNQSLFDVVIFDEASQIPVWDAVGAIARGRQVIVAGDPKQMPPSNFFGRAVADEDEEVDAEGDLESILDEMLGASIPERRLRLHYRSRRESLIAFSNTRYYENSLITFPAPVYPDCGVSLHRPDGHYARGKARHNEGEARAIVAEITRRLSADDADLNQRSIGVVTFNAEQQTLIENLLDEERRKRPELEAAFNPESATEPVFVKNLETVQGDERDVILFSVTYGPDQSGHVTMNFGPLNRAGGERRLNVALTRARSEMLVFSTLSPEQIDLSRTQATAVADLKHFLEFAERGPRALGEAVHGSIGDFDSPFESAVAQALRDKGWDVHPQIGVSSFRIDLGIVHPDVPGMYLAGVECDGAKYHSSAFARERDKIRQAVLEGLGWRLERVWSTDWWTNRGKALDDLKAALKDHLAADRAARADAAAKTDAAPAAEPANAAAEGQPVGDADAAEPAVAADPASEDVVAAPHTSAGTDPEVTRFQRPVGVSAAVAADDAPPDAAQAGPVASVYRPADLSDAGLTADADAFYDAAYDTRLGAMVEHVVEQEGPVHEDVLVWRIAGHHGFRRAGRQIRQRVLDLAEGRCATTDEDVGRFYWPGSAADQVPARCAGRDDTLRKVDRIAAEELRQIDHELGLAGDPQAVARSLGVGRLSRTARARLESVLAATTG